MPKTVKEIKARPDLIDALVGQVAPCIVDAANTEEPKLTVKKRLNITMAPADYKLFEIIRKSYKMKPEEMVNRVLWLLCRAIRTGRDPWTGEVINWNSGIARIPKHLRDELGL